MTKIMRFNNDRRINALLVERYETHSGRFSVRMASISSSPTSEDVFPEADELGTLLYSTLFIVRSYKNRNCCSSTKHKAERSKRIC